MSRGDKWIPIDKYLSQEFKYIDRPLSRIEAMFSYTLDKDEGVVGSVKGYANLWQWSRNKVRKFIQEIETPEGHQRDKVRTPYRHPIHLIDKAFWVDKDTEETPDGHQQDTKPTPTSKPKPKPEPKRDSKKFSAKGYKPDFITDEQWSVLLETRKLKKVLNTEAALKPFVTQIEKAIELGFDVEYCIGEYANSSWSRFKAEWLKEKTFGNSSSAESVKNDQATCGDCETFKTTCSFRPAGQNACGKFEPKNK